MAEPWLDVAEKITEFFTTAQLEACARRTGFVQRASKITGKVFLALVTLGVWSTRKISLGQLAAKAAQLPTPVGISPEALHQRMNHRAVAFLRALLLQRAFAQFHTGTAVCDTELFAPFTVVHIADSTGFTLPPCGASSPAVVVGQVRPESKFNWCGNISARASPTWRGSRDDAR